MEIVIKILQFIMSFSLLVIVHELGHFMFARMFGVRVEKFYLFFNPWFSLVKFKIGETEYGIGWIPFGGYVKIAGMVDESLDTDQLAQPAQPYEFRSKPAWQRLLIMTGGVIMNVVLALCIYIGMCYAWGDNYYSNKDVANGYEFTELGRSMGFQNGDKILTVNGKELDNYLKITETIMLDEGRKISVLRDGQQVDFQIGEEIIPKLIKAKVPFLDPRSFFVVDSLKEGGVATKAGFAKGDSIVAVAGVEMRFHDQIVDAFGQNKDKAVDVTVKRDSAGVSIPKMLTVNVTDAGTIEVFTQRFIASMPVRKVEYSFAKSIPAGFNRTGEKISSYWKQLKMIVSPKTEAYKSIGGPIMIGNIFPDFWSLEIFWNITAFLSIVLAVMNILPIPALDGGHVLFLLYEVVTRRKPSDKFLERAQVMGMVLVFGLLIVASFNDILKIFTK